MKYQNIKTAAVIETESIVEGKDWQAVEPAGQPEKTSRKRKQVVKDE